jgi:hypothetical protein
MPQTLEDRLEGLARGRETAARNRAAKQAKDEAADYFEAQLADTNQALGTPFEREVVADAAATVAASYDAERDPITGGDVTATAALALAAAAVRHNQPVDTPTLQSELQSVGTPVLRPEGILSRDEERARAEKNRAEIMLLMSAPSSKRLRQLQALRESPPFSFYCPVDIPTGHINGVPIVIYEGLIPPKTPGSLGLGCLMVAQFVEHVIGRRGWATNDSRRLKLQEILDPEVDEARNQTATRPAAGIY